MDPQANASTGLGVDVSPKIESVYDILINNKNINDCIKKTSVDYLDILPSCSKLAGAEIELVGMLTRESILKEAGGFIDFFEPDNEAPLKKNILASNANIHKELSDLIIKKNIE